MTRFTGAYMRTGCPNTQVKEIEFKSYLWWPLFRYRVTGTVKWDFGDEVTWWFIRGDGKLEEYWYSCSGET
ncbi:MAG TPA: hypothetical protein VFM05_02180 [Candidatus Saccharimonadales bacterium]|nr:hypothetical protein [Candidatus Saccharimonadales bacterium]